MKLLIIHKTQFGYHNNAYKLCQYLNDRIDITYLCFDGHKKIDMDGVKVKYIHASSTKVFRAIMYMFISIMYVFFWRGGIMVYYFPGSEWYKRLFPWKKMLLDIRTLSISNNEEENRIADARLKNTTDKYDFVTFLSEGMRDKIGYCKEKTAIVPLGSDVISKAQKSYYPIKLLYVGTLWNRKLEKTLEGLKLFKDKYPEAQIEYHIIGDAGEKHHDQEILMYNFVKSNGMEQIVHFYGRIPNKELKPFFDMCNIGVSFVPITPYYDYQPVTKTFEYAMSGLYVIATSTYENSKVINTQNGIIIRDTSEDFAYAIEEIVNNYNKIEETKVRESLKEYSWKNIENSIMWPILNKLFCQNGW